MSTARSGEELLHPRVTLSFLLSTLLYGPPDVVVLALDIGSNDLKLEMKQGGVTNLPR